ncbi:hypothetical protein QQF64_025335 [Cirrhinus molitorella]|uniref:Uncharacterized protein n=1 Tax=Cirrhinus molitorella TaxID=172907 RepID=A0ABR3NP47_9TELE
MAEVKACNILITGANRGLGLETVKQLSQDSCPKRHIFATCRDPDGPKSEALRELAKKHPSVITIIRLDADDPCSIKESAKKVGSLLGNSGLNLLLNNAAILAKGTIQTSSVEDLKNTFNTNVIGPLLIIKEYLPYLQTAAKASGTPGMSCNKAAVINISTVGGSISTMPSFYGQFPLLPYCVSKAGLNMLTVLAAEEVKADQILCMALHPGWVRTELGGEKAPLEPKESVEGMLRVIGSLTEKEHGGFLDYTGKTIPCMMQHNTSVQNGCGVHSVYIKSTSKKQAGRP